MLSEVRTENSTADHHVTSTKQRPTAPGWIRTAGGSKSQSSARADNSGKYDFRQTASVHSTLLNNDCKHTFTPWTKNTHFRKSNRHQVNRNSLNVFDCQSQTYLWVQPPCRIPEEKHTSLLPTAAASAGSCTTSTGSGPESVRLFYRHNGSLRALD